MRTILCTLALTCTALCFTAAAAASDGDFSPDFGGGSGYAIRALDLGGGPSFNLDLDELDNLALKADGSWLTAGESCCDNGHPNYVVARWLASGAVDTSYGSMGSGYVFGNTPSADQSVGGIVTGPAGRGVVALNIYAQIAGVEGAMLMGLTSTGAFNGQSGVDSDATFIALVSGAHTTPSRTDAEGTYFGVGWRSDATHFQIAHVQGYTAALGAPSGFGSAGKIDIDLSTAYTQAGSSRYDNRFFAAAMQPDGKLVACGYVPYNGDDTDFIVMRFNRDGTPDASFNNAGYVTLAFDRGGAKTDECRALAIQRDGKIVIAGNSSQASGKAASLARLTGAGVLDTSFASAGSGRLSFAFIGIGNSDDNVNAIALQPNGDIVVVGSVYDGSSFRLATARVLPNGTLDASYRGAGGSAYTFSGVSSSSGNAVAIDHRGQIAIVGSATQTGKTTSDQLLLKLRNDDSIFLDGYDDF